MIKIFIKSFIFLFFCSFFNIYAKEKEALAIINNNYIISNYDLENKLKFIKLTANHLNTESKDFKKIILQEMILNYLILEEARQYNIQVSQEEIQEAIKALEENRKTSFSQIENQAQQMGLTKSIFQEEIRKELLINKAKQTISFSRSSVSQTDINNEVNKILSLNGKVDLKLYEITINTMGKSQDSINKKLEVIVNSLKEGANFQNVARNFSESLTYNTGGDLGWIPEDFLGINIANQIKSLQKGQYTNPILTDNYYRIFYLDDIRPLIQVNPNSVEHIQELNKFVKQKLLYEKSQVVLNEYLQDLYYNSSIVIFNK